MATTQKKPDGCDYSCDDSVSGSIGNQNKTVEKNTEDIPDIKDSKDTNENAFALQAQDENGQKKGHELLNDLDHSISYQNCTVESNRAEIPDSELSKDPIENPSAVQVQDINEDKGGYELLRDSIGYQNLTVEKNAEDSLDSEISKDTNEYAEGQDKNDDKKAQSDASDSIVVEEKAKDTNEDKNGQTDDSANVNEKTESFGGYKNEEEDIPEISLDQNNKDEATEKFTLKHDYSEEIVQLLPPDLVEDDPINLNSMKVMCNNFFEENNHNNEICNEETDKVTMATREDSDYCITDHDVITEPIRPSSDDHWFVKNKKTYELCIPYTNLSKIMDKGYSGGSVFDDIPDELIVKIFSFLTTQELCLYAAPVCRKWRAISQDHSLWRSLDFSACSRITTLNLLWVIRRAPMLLKLNLSGRSHITHPEVAILTESCPFLEEMDLGFCEDLNCGMIKTISQNCPHLKKINVEGCEKMDYKCAACFIWCKELTHLNVSHCIQLGDKAVAILSRGLPNLLSINLDGIDAMTDCAVENLVYKHSQHLEEVALDGAEISDVGIQQLSLCPQLKHLELSFSECLTDQSLEYLKELKNLEILRLRRGCDLTATGLSTFFKSASLSKLKCLHLSECTQVNDEVVLDLVQACGVTLRELALSWCWFITDTGLISIVDHCCNMETLDLIGIHQISGDCLSRVPEEMPKLRYLDLKQCNKIVDSLIVDVVLRKPDLVVVNYYGEEFIHD